MNWKFLNHFWQLIADHITKDIQRKKVTTTQTTQHTASAMSFFGLSRGVWFQCFLGKAICLLQRASSQVPCTNAKLLNGCWIVGIPKLWFFHALGSTVGNRSSQTERKKTSAAPTNPRQSKNAEFSARCIQIAEFLFITHCNTFIFWSGFQSQWLSQFGYTYAHTPLPHPLIPKILQIISTRQCSITIHSTCSAGTF